MAVPPVVDTLTNLQNESSAVAKINLNAQRAAEAIGKTLSTSDISQNTMNVSLDMNSQRILNLPPPNNPSDPVRRSDVPDLISLIKVGPQGPQGPVGPQGPAGTGGSGGSGVIVGTTPGTVAAGDDTRIVNALNKASLPVFSTADPQWGIVADGVTDCSAALQTMLNAVPDGSTVLWWPGNYNLNTTGLTCDNKSITHVSLSRGSSRIFYSGTGVALSHTTTSVLHQVQVQNLVFVYKGSGVAGTALKIARPTGLNSNIEQGCVIDGCQFYGTRTGTGGSQTSTSTGWLIGMNLIACWNSTVQNTFWRGKDADYTGQVCVVTDHTTPVTLLNNIWTYGLCGFKATAGSISEGLNAYHNQLVAFLDGFVLADGGAAPLAQIIGNHVNSARFGVRCLNRPQIMVKDNLFYNWNYAVSGQNVGNYDYVGVQLEAGCSNSIVSGNTVIGYKDVPGVTSNIITGVVMQQADASIVSNNIVQGCKLGFNGVNQWRGMLSHNITQNCTMDIDGAATILNLDNYNYNNPIQPVKL